MRYGKIHAFNNYYYKNEIGAQARSGAYFFSENEIFDAPYMGAYPRVRAGVDNGEALPASVKVTNPWLLNGGTYEERNTGSMFNPSATYSYTPDTANSTLRTNIINGAGRQEVTTAISPPTNLVVK
jgi:pectate lyase